MKQQDEDYPRMCLECRIGTGRGVPTTKCWETAVRDAIPIIHEGVEVQTKMVLLTMAPGDSQQELGTMFTLRRKDSTGRYPMMKKDKLLDL